MNYAPITQHDSPQSAPKRIELGGFECLQPATNKKVFKILDSKICQLILMVFNTAEQVIQVMTSNSRSSLLLL